MLADLVVKTLNTSVVLMLCQVSVLHGEARISPATPRDQPKEQSGTQRRACFWLEALSSVYSHAYTHECTCGGDSGFEYALKTLGSLVALRAGECGSSARMK